MFWFSASKISRSFHPAWTSRGELYRVYVGCVAYFCFPADPLHRLLYRCDYVFDMVYPVPFDRWSVLRVFLIHYLFSSGTRVAISIKVELLLLNLSATETRAAPSCQLSSKISLRDRTSTCTVEYLLIMHGSHHVCSSWCIGWAPQDLAAVQCVPTLVIHQSHIA